MALPKWITPAGDLGIVPELEYYQYALDAYDPSGGTFTGNIANNSSTVTGITSNIYLRAGKTITGTGIPPNTTIISVVSGTSNILLSANATASITGATLSVNPLIYSLTSGKLPPGIQITPAGKLLGIPVSELSGDKNVNYRFTIRAKNPETSEVADRTFSLTITNIAPPVITPRDVNLGVYLDGTVVNEQLVAVEATPGATLTWKLTKGELPNGLYLSKSGLLYGYVKPIIPPGPNSEPNWDKTPWNLLGWDFTPNAVSKTYVFTIEVFDGVNYDTSTYKLKVFPKSSLRADNDELTVDTGRLNSGEGLSDIDGVLHYPIITTVQEDLVDVRSSSYFSFNVDAIDIDGDVLEYTLPKLASGAFDEQDFTSVISYPYVAAQTISNNLYAATSPKINILNTAATIRLSASNLVTANIGDYISQPLSGANATITGNITNSTTIPVTVTKNNFIEERGNLLLTSDASTNRTITTSGNITANVGEFITQTSSGANATVLVSVINNSNVIVSYNTSNAFVTGSGNIAISSTSTSVYPTAVSKTIDLGFAPYVVTTGEQVIVIDPTTPNLLPGDIIKVLDTNKLWKIATVNNYTTVRLIGNVIVTGNVGDSITQNSHTVTANLTSISTTTGYITVTGNVVTANVGDFITQPSTGANATVTSNVAYVDRIPVTFTSGTFTTGSGNIAINGSYDANVSINVYPSSAIYNTDLSVEYTGSLATTGVFSLSSPTANIKINGTEFSSYPLTVVSVGVTLGSAATEGTLGFDETKFDQGALALPEGLSINADTGWMTGHLPAQTQDRVEYDFEVVVYKRDDSTYRSSKLYTLTVLGDLNNRIEWVSSSYIGTIENGRISDLYVKAVSTINKPLTYKLTSDHRLPQGLVLTTDGLISGRVSFELFGLDNNSTTIDNNQTIFDNLYTFTVVASDYAKTVSATKTFTIRVLPRNTKPYEDLYLRALLPQSQRDLFRSIISDTSVFPPDLIYRSSDPFFGVVKEIKTLFLPGLEPSTLAEYTQAAEINHFTKHIRFGDIKTAVVLDSNFDVKYEVVYIELADDNTNSSGQGPNNTLQLSSIIENPYYDSASSSYTTAYPNSFSNMSSQIINSIGYANKGALPDWMTSRQPNGRVLGFTRAAVIAYTVPGESDKIAYRLASLGFNFNKLEFTVDRYQIDNSYSSNYDFDNQQFLTSTETTFDRYPALSSAFTSQGTVDYALTTSYDEINNRLLSEIKANGGMDGYRNFKDGDTLVFGIQEFFRDQRDIGEYNQGWTDVQTLWDSDAWDYDVDTSDNPYTERYGYIVVPWAVNTEIQIGYTVLHGSDYYRANVTYITGSTFSTTTTIGSTVVEALIAIPTPSVPDVTPAVAWDAAGYVPGYNENLFDPTVENKRAGIWQININGTGIVTLSFIQSIEFYDTLYVRHGNTYGGTNIFFDPVVKSGFVVPSYSIIPEQIKTTYTTFDGNGTRFFNYRNSYTVPGSEDKYIKFTKTGVFT